MTWLSGPRFTQHPTSGRWYHSQFELIVHNYLVETKTPYYSGVDPQVLFPPNNKRSDDIVIPERPTLDLPEVRIEVAGMWENRMFGEEKMMKYRNDKTEVHNYWINRDVIHILLKPIGRSNLPRKYLEQELGKYVGGSQALIDALEPPRRPAATYNAEKEMLEAIQSFFTKGDQITSTLILKKLGPGFYSRLTKFYPNQTLHTVAERCNLSTMNAPYGETQAQFISRLRDMMNERYGGLLPSSEKLRIEESWVNERATHFFGSYRNLRTHLGLGQLRREPYTLSEVKELLTGICVDGVNPTTSEVYRQYPGLVDFLHRNCRIEDEPFQVILSRLLGTEMNVTRLPMASYCETVSWLENNSVNNCLPDIRQGAVPSPIFRRLENECVERGWGLWGIPVTASRLTRGLKPKRVKLEGRNLPAPPLIEQILEDLSRAAQTYGREVVKEWDPTTLRNYEKRLSNNLGILARQIGLSKKLIHYDMLRIPWLERRDARNRIIRCTECWIGWSRDLQVRNPTDILTSKERQAYVNPFNKFYRTRFPNVESAFTAAREVEHPEWYVNHPFLDRIWDSNNPFDEWIVLVSH